MKTRSAGALFFLGFYLGPFGDLFHVLTGTLAYPPEEYRITFFGIPFWVPILFGSATLIMGWIYHRVLKWDVGAPRATLWNVWIPALGFLGVYISSGFLAQRGEVFAAITLGACATAMLFLFHRTSLGALLCMLAAVAGTGTEILLVKQGVFEYLPPHDGLFGVPQWLPWLYVAAAVAIMGMVRRLEPIAAQIPPRAEYGRRFDATDSDQVSGTPRA